VSKEIAIEVKNLSKHFRLPTEKASGIKQAVVNRFKGIKGYKEQKVLRNISFDVKKGDFFGIVGRNGSGKSTLLKLISGIYEPDGGSIKVNGSLVSFIELGVGFNNELTGRENVYLNGALMGFSVKEIDAMYDEIVEFAELGEFMDQKLKNYSSGMQVRLAFSCAIRAKSDILVLDEVLAVGDEAFQRKCYQYFARLRKNRQTIILVTHSMDTVREYCSKAILIDGGKIIKADSANSVANEYSKLFNKSIVADEGFGSKQLKRWGTGEVRVIKVKAMADEHEIKIDLKIQSTIAVESIVVAVRLSLLSGVLIAGMSTKRMMNYKKLAIKKNEIKQIVFTIPNNLGKKDVNIGTLIATSDNTVTFDNWDEAALINNPNNESYYPIVYDSKVEVY